MCVKAIKCVYMVGRAFAAEIAEERAFVHMTEDETRVSRVGALVFVCTRGVELNASNVVDLKYALMAGKEGIASCATRDSYVNTATSGKLVNVAAPWR